jgi:hypothetical protein
LIGTAAGSGAPSILTAIAKASLSADAVIVPTCVATAFKMTAAGKINLTVAGSCPKSVIGAEVVWFEQLDGGLARA